MVGKMCKCGHREGYHSQSSQNQKFICTPEIHHEDIKTFIKKEKEKSFNQGKNSL